MASSISEAQAELISSLTPDDIPIKLRCAICSKLAVNAFRLPCCEQAICEPCQSNLPSSCPVCEHSPLSAEDCNPNKSLRTTIKVFLRTAEKKREALRAKEAKETTPAPSAEPAQLQPQKEPSSEPVAPEAPAHEALSGDGEPAAVEQTIEAQGFPPGDSEQPNHKDDAPAEPAPTDEENPADRSIEKADGSHEGEQTGDANEPTENQDEDEAEQTGDGQQNLGPGAMEGGFQNMNYQGSDDFNQMQMMMAMQNGMGPNSFGGFPMMGMPGMGMDPMMMQNMYGGFQGMGMNGMGGFGGVFGQGANNNWNGSQSWNFDQNNFNQNGPMGAGDFGNFNSGFQTGYNQGNYGHQFNDYRRGFGRGRGRGRGFYGAGGYGYGRGGYQNASGHAQYQDHQANAQYGGGQGHIDNQGHGEQNEHGASVQGEGGTGEQGPEGATQDSSVLASREGHGTGENTPSGPNGHGPGLGAIRSVASAPDVPINAPTGPKAMRQGLPNTSLHHLRARGYQVGEQPRPQSQSQTPHPESPRPQSRSESQARDRARDHSHDGERTRDRQDDDKVERHGHDGGGDHVRGRSRSRSRTASQSRSRSRGHRSSRRHRRHRSTSADDEYDGDGYRRKRHRSRKHDDDDDEQYPRSKEDKYADRSRSASPDDGKRSSHRSSRKDRDYDRRRERDKDRYRDDDRKKAGHRSHRDRDRDYESSRRRDRDRERDRDRKDRKDRERRDRDTDRDSRDHKLASNGTSRRGSADGSGAQTPVDKDFKPPTGPRGSHSRSQHDRRSSQTSSTAPSGAPAKDVHTLEREARDRERLIKEAQRRAVMRGSKRGREDDGGGDDGGRKSRRSSRRSEAVDGVDEERLSRLEAEREGGRWG